MNSAENLPHPSFDASLREWAEWAEAHQLSLQDILRDAVTLFGLVTRSEDFIAAEFQEELTLESTFREAYFYINRAGLGFENFYELTYLLLIELKYL